MNPENVRANARAVAIQLITTPAEPARDDKQVFISRSAGRSNPVS
jgi:hypothetical protein